MLLLRLCYWEMMKNLKIVFVIVMLFCAFSLGRIHESTRYLEAISKCADPSNIDNISMQEFYGHKFKGMEDTLWNHAVAHNANIYWNCMQKELNK